MTTKETFRERQDGEFEVLKAIYNEDLEDLRPTQDKWMPLDLRIKLTPQKDSKQLVQYVSTYLRITCTKHYPKIPPKITLEETVGLHNDTITSLLNQLTKLAFDLKGEVMIFELAGTVNSTLSQHNNVPKGSFYEEMLLTKQKQEESTHQQNKLKEDKIRQAIQDEVMKRKLELQKETKIKRSCSESSPMHRRSGSTEVEMLSKNLHFVKECEEHQRSHLIQFSSAGRRIQQGNCIGHSEKGCIHFSGIDLDSGELCFLTEFTIPLTVLESTSKTVDEVIKDIERQVSSLPPICHKNLVGYKCVQCFKKKENLLVYLCQEFIQGNSIYCIYNSLGFHSDGVSLVAKGVLEALIYLHNNGVSHSNLNDSTVFLDSLGVVRVSDYSIVPYLQELASNERSLSNDLPALGALVESLLISSNPEMKDFVDKCKSERTLSASDLLEHPFLYPHLNVNSHNALNQNQTQLLPVLVPDRPQFNITFPNLTETICEKSRLQTEFEIMNFIGKGAFGDVLKVRNILDNRQYAIKRIPLTYKNKQLYRKMTREVELLSRLNHENVVRYYNSWIENSAPNSTIIGSELSEDQDTYSVSHESAKRKQDVKQIITAKNLDSSDESLSDWIDFQSSSSGSDSIEFVDSKGGIVHYEDEEDEEDTPKKDRGPRIIQLMYIQMEFCEKSTLRTAIDSDLYKDKERYWRLFREIVEGLAHIHQQGMIHRDLKPVNIFLDSKDCVKIGDFGLATTSVLALNNQILPSKIHSSQNYGESLTGQVGTALYISPELTGSASKCSYNQKVDLYSLGIIFFEMCTQAATTGMERIKTIAALRTIDVEIPEYLLKDVQCQNEVELLKWLLNHDASKRPTSEELLQSELVPPAKLEAQELQEMVRHCLANPQSRTYKHLIQKCLMQQSDAVCELTYHLGMVQVSALFENVKNKIVHIFRKHGALDIVTPLLTPHNKESSHNAVKLMTHSGSVVCLPYDLRQPFLHFMALNNLNYIRRYTIGRVYREKKIFNFHPKQLFECNFDIITPNRLNFLIDAEVLLVASEIVSEFESLKQKQICFRINHTGLLKAIFLYCSVPKDKYKELLGLLGNFVDQKLSKFQLTSAVNSLLPWNNNSLLMELLQIEMNVANLHSSSLRTLIKGKGEATTIAKAALRELEAIVNLAQQGMSVSIPIVVQVGLALGFDLTRPGGIVWQLVGELKSGRQKTVMACGGSYDHVLNEYQKKAQQSGVNIVSREMSSSGFSFALDKLVLALSQLNDSNAQTVDVVVFMTSSRPPLKEVLGLLRSLWSAEIRTCVLEATLFDEDVAKDLGANHIILLGDGGELRLKTWHNDSFYERYVTWIDIIEKIKKNLTPESSGLQDLYQINRNNSITSFNKAPQTTAPTFDCIFSINEKLTINKKKRLENQVEQKLSNIILKFNKKEHLIIFVVDLPILAVKALVSAIEPNPKEQQSQAELDLILERFPKQRRYIAEIFDEITEKKFKTKQAVVGIYSISDSYYRLIL